MQSPRLLGPQQWMQARNPIARRDAQRLKALPPLLRRLGEARSILGYAALIHFSLFIVGLLTYSKGLQSPFVAALAPFLTPLGLPLAVGVLHTLLYWSALIGACNLVSGLISRDRASGAFETLRMTPLSASEILWGKLSAARIVWFGGLATLVVTRIVMALAYPIMILMDLRRPTVSDVILLLCFIMQPVVDFFLASTVSALVALYNTDRLSARFGSYALFGLIYGALSIVTVVWLSFEQLGPIAGILAPLNHWTLLLEALMPVNKPELRFTAGIVVSLTQFLLPALIAWMTFRLAVFLLKRGPLS